MHIITGILATLVIFAILVVVHEGGHFFTAKAVGIRVNEFSIGMGPLLLKKDRGETQYSIRAIPIGGYVAMEGESEESDDDRAFNNKPAWQRALVLAAGPFMNFVLAVLVIAGMLTYFGTSVTSAVAAVEEGSPAYTAGLREGDRIIAVNGTETPDGTAVSEEIRKSLTDDNTVTVEYAKSSGEHQTAEVGYYEAEDGVKRIGVRFQAGHNPLTGLRYAFIQSVDMEKQMLIVLKDLLVGKGSVDDVAGPVGIVTIVDQTAQVGIANLLYLMALLSLNLGLVNILPFPALDGGRLLFLLIRKITGKAITDTVENSIHYFGLLVLFALMIMITFKDINTFILH